MNAQKKSQERDRLIKRIDALQWLEENGVWHNEDPSMLEVRSLFQIKPPIGFQGRAAKISHFKRAVTYLLGDLDGVKREEE